MKYTKTLDHVIAALVLAKTKPQKAVAHFKAAVAASDAKTVVAALEAHQKKAFKVAVASVKGPGTRNTDLARLLAVAAKKPKKGATPAKGKKKVKADLDGDDGFGSVLDGLTGQEADLDDGTDGDLTLDEIDQDVRELPEADVDGDLDGDLDLDVDLDGGDADLGLDGDLDNMDDGTEESDGEDDDFSFDSLDGEEADADDGEDDGYGEDDDDTVESRLRNTSRANRNLRAMASVVRRKA